MVSTRANNYETKSTYQTKSTIKMVNQIPTHTYNLRNRKNTSCPLDNQTMIDVSNEVDNFVSNIKNEIATSRYYLRSSKQVSPRINYYRFYTSRPDTYTQHVLVRRSPRIQSMTTPRPSYVEE
jgi:hypothetical protein